MQRLRRDRWMMAAALLLLTLLGGAVVQLLMSGPRVGKAPLDRTGNPLGTVEERATSQPAEAEDERVLDTSGGHSPSTSASGQPEGDRERPEDTSGAGTPPDPAPQPNFAHHLTIAIELPADGPIDGDWHPICMRPRGSMEMFPTPFVALDANARVQGGVGLSGARKQTDETWLVGTAIHALVDLARVRAAGGLTVALATALVRLDADGAVVPGALWIVADEVQLSVADVEHSARTREAVLLKATGRDAHSHVTLTGPAEQRPGGYVVDVRFLPRSQTDSASVDNDYAWPTLELTRPLRRGFDVGYTPADEFGELQVFGLPRGWGIRAPMSAGARGGASAGSFSHGMDMPPSALADSVGAMRCPLGVPLIELPRRGGHIAVPNGRETWELVALDGVLPRVRVVSGLPGEGLRGAQIDAFVLRQRLHRGARVAIERTPLATMRSAQSELHWGGIQYGVTWTPGMEIELVVNGRGFEATRVRATLDPQSVVDVVVDRITNGWTLVVDATDFDGAPITASFSVNASVPSGVSRDAYVLAIRGRCTVADAFPFVLDGGPEGDPQVPTLSCNGWRNVSRMGFAIATADPALESVFGNFQSAPGARPAGARDRVAGRRRDSHDHASSARKLRRDRGAQRRKRAIVAERLPRRLRHWRCVRRGDTDAALPERDHHATLV